MTGLKDKNGFDIPFDYIIKGIYEGKEHYFSTFKRDDSVHMIACTYGYVHNIKQSDIEGFELIGSDEDYKHLLECD